jgi:hypothetical protein
VDGPELGPPEDAYGRVTDPERYAVLHDVVRGLVDDLTARYVVERFDGWHDPDLVGRVPHVVSTLRLLPAGGGAPITIALTAFPGVLARFGRWHVEPFPSCGCDACDEKPDDVAVELSRYVDAVVEGRFLEEWRGDVLRYEIRGDDRRSGTMSVLDRRTAQELGPPSRVEWPAWGRR